MDVVLMCTLLVTLAPSDAGLWVTPPATADAEADGEPPPSNERTRGAFFDAALQRVVLTGGFT